MSSCTVSSLPRISSLSNSLHVSSADPACMTARASGTVFCSFVNNVFLHAVKAEHSNRRLLHFGTASAMSEVKKVAPEEAAELLKSGAKYLDVRTPEEFAAGHADGAINIPISFQGMVPNPEFMAQVKEKFTNPQEQILVGCKAGGRSARACAMLRADYQNLIDNTAGWDGWTAANLPVTK